MVVQEQVTTRARHDRKIASMKQLHDAEQAALLRTLNSAKCQTATKIAELTEKLNAAQRQTFALHWQSARNVRQMQRFSALGFADYVKAVVGL